MNKTILKYVVAGVLVLGAAGLAISNISPQSANAQDGAPQGDNSQTAAQIGTDMAANIETAWALRCSEGVDVDAAESKRGVCELFQRQDVRDSGERIIEFALGYPEGQDVARGIFILPTGILLQEGVKLRVDDGNQFEFHPRYCIPNGCIAYITVNDDLMKQMSSGKNMFVDIFQGNEQMITIPMPLKGFSKALADISN
ncbi:MAG: invasion associated locus B family protein [Alphaproteobacteria bacterium]